MAGACGGHLPNDRTHWNVNPAEMNHWSPPDESVLSARRANQLRLDDLTREVEVLFINQASLSQQELSLYKLMLQVGPQITNMESSFQKQLDTEQKRVKRMQKDLEMAKLGFLDAESRLKRIMLVKPPIVFSVSDYNTAMKNFRDGNLKKSLKLLAKLNKQKPPLFLKDNIHFGMGSIYYRLKKYPEAIKHFQKILDHYAKGDKRFISYYMMAVIHNAEGNKSRAVFVLDEALKNNPPQKMRNMIHRLLMIINDEPTHAAG